MKNRLLSGCLAVLFICSSAGAASLSDGERIAATCAGCHGTMGAAPGSHIPIIGGQGEAYLKQTMKDYRDGKRPGGVMANLAKGYSDSQIDEMSRVITTWRWENTRQGSADRKKTKKMVVSVGSCAACHGKLGEGTEISPHIAGQTSGYLKEALFEYKTGKRTSAEMELIRDLSEKDLDALVIYYTTLGKK